MCSRVSGFLNCAFWRRSPCEMLVRDNVRLLLQVWRYLLRFSNSEFWTQAQLKRGFRAGLLEGHIHARPRGAYPRRAVHDLLVGDGELAEKMADHVGLDLNRSVFLSSMKMDRQP